jgi:DNA-binding NarL/FixJ family response regulator
MERMLEGARLVEVKGNWASLAEVPATASLEAVLAHGIDGEDPSDLPVVLLSDEPSIPGEVARTGFRAVLASGSPAALIEAALVAVANGYMLMLTDFEPDSFAPRARSSVEPVESQGEALSPRELEVLRMLAEGVSNKEIAWRLNISEHTVKFHVASILSKLGAGSRTEAVTIGIRRGLIYL